MAKSFSAQISEQVAQSLKNLEYIAKNAIQDVVQAAQTSQPGASRVGSNNYVTGKIPVVSGDLRDSLTVGGSVGAEAYVTAIASFEIGNDITFSWTQPYGPRIEFGFTGTDSLGRIYNQGGRHFIGANAARWPEFVAKRASEVA